MKLFTFTIFFITAFTASNLYAQCTSGSASITKWSHQSITSPSQIIYDSTEMENGTFTTTDCTGEQVTMTLNFQRDTSGNWSDGIGGYDYRIRQWDNASSNFKLTFSKPVAIQSLQIKDLDNQWDTDEVIVSAKNSSGANVVVSISNTGYVTVNQASQTIRGNSHTKGYATLSTTDEITELNIQYNSGRIGQTQQGEQQILIGDLEYCCPSGQLSLQPVSLLHFTAEKVGNFVELNWATATESNNKKFRVEYSFDGLNYFSIYDVQGAGTSSEQKNYSLIHSGIFNQGSDKIYYRLAQIDFDGALTYVGDVQIISLKNGNEILAYPVPANVGEAIKISGANQLGVYKIYNLSGQFIQSGLSTSRQLEVQTYGMAKGVYYIHFASGEISKFILK